MRVLPALFAVVLLSTVTLVFAGSEAKSAKNSLSPTISTGAQDQHWMIEGEKRYRANCGRCHQPPHKFPPRPMATTIRHMRVRAMLTEDDAKYITYYMTH